jgi:hypothetical protein
MNLVQNIRKHPVPKLLYLYLAANLGLQTSFIAPPDQPKQIAHKWLTAIYSADWTTAKNLSTPECQQLITIQAMFLEVMEKEQAATYKKTGWEIVGDPQLVSASRIYIKYRDLHYPSETSKIPLTLVNDQWLVNLTKDSYQQDMEMRNLDESDALDSSMTDKAKTHGVK